MNRSDLVKIIRENTELPSLVIDSVLCEAMLAIKDAVRSGEEVRLTGFGSFKRKDRPARIGRNVRTGEKITIPAKTVPTFKASKDFLEKHSL